MQRFMTCARVKSATADLVSASTSGIDIINVTDKIPRTSELDQDPGSIGPRTINLDQAGDDPEHHVG